MIGAKLDRLLWRTPRKAPPDKQTKQFSCTLKYLLWSARDKLLDKPLKFLPTSD